MTVQGRTTAIVLLAVLAAARGWWYLRGRGVEVETVAVTLGSLSRTIEEDGYVEAVGDRWIHATQTARVNEVAVETGRKDDVLMLPVESIRTNHDGAREVLKVSGGRIDLAPAETGISDRRNVKILSGVAQGDLVVRDAGQDLPGGTKVR